MTIPVFHVDPAYLEAPYIAHVPRRAVLLRMCVPCWEDACHDCQGGACVCACETRRTVPSPVPLCTSCGYRRDSVGHQVTCEPQALERRVPAIAESVGRAA